MGYANSSKAPQKASKSTVSKRPYKGAAHTAKSQKGMGDYYGTGIVAKLGRVRDGSMGMQAISSKAMKKPPRSLA